MKKKRLNLDFPAGTMRVLGSLKERSEAASYTEVIKKSLSVYDAILAAKDGGERIMLRSADGKERELILIG